MTQKYFKVKNGLEIVDAYVLPNTPGINGQVLTTDGAGVATWSDDSTPWTDLDLKAGTTVGGAKLDLIVADVPTFELLSTVKILSGSNISVSSPAADTIVIDSVASDSTLLPVKNSGGVLEFEATDITGMQFAAAGSTTVAFDAGNRRVTYSSTDAPYTLSVDVEPQLGPSDGFVLKLDSTLSSSQVIVGAGTGLSTSFTGIGDVELTNTGAITVNSQSGTVVLDTDDIAEGVVNEYFTVARARQSISATGDINYDNGTGVISFTATAAPVTSVNGATGVVVLDTDDITEGVANLYYSSALFDADLATKTTTDLAEGTNLYYTDARVDAHLSGGVGVDYTTGVISIGQPVAITDDVEFNDLTLTGTGADPSTLLIRNKGTGTNDAVTDQFNIAQWNVGGWDGAEYTSDSLASFYMAVFAAENWANDGLGNTTASGTDFAIKAQVEGYRPNYQVQPTLNRVLESRLNAVGTQSFPPVSATAGNGATYLDPGRRVMFLGDNTVAGIEQTLITTDGNNEILGLPRTDVSFQNSVFSINGVTEDYAEWTLDTLDNQGIIGNVRAFMSTSIPLGVGQTFGYLTIITGSPTPPSFMVPGASLTSTDATSATLPAGTQVLSYYGPRPGFSTQHIYKVSTVVFFSPSAGNNVSVGHYKLTATETTGAIEGLQTVYTDLTAQPQSHIFKDAVGDLWSSDAITAAPTALMVSGSQNASIDETNRLRFLTGRYSAQPGKRNRLKSGDSIARVQAAGWNDDSLFLPVTADAHTSELRFYTTEDYTATNGGSGFDIQLVKAGTTTEYTALDLQSASATVRGDDLYLKDSNDVEIWGDRIHYNRVYGDFVDTDTHGPAPVNTTQTVQFNTQVLANGISIVNGGEITFEHNDHTYLLTTNLSFVKTGGGDAIVSVWLVEKEPLGVETTVSNSRFVINITGNGAREGRTITWMVDPLIGEYYKIYWQSDATGVSLEALPAVGVLPGAPSAAVQILPVGA